VDAIIDALNDVFAFEQAPALTPDTRLEEIPDWDSMNAVNLQMRLEARLGKSLKGLPITGRMTLGELQTALRAAGALA
jgi:acyl carrier protein